MADEPRKRSRFDQTEPEKPRLSRFDRRSRSPADRKPSDTRRSRSPLRDSSSPGVAAKDPAKAAAEAAARIIAQLQAKKGIQHVDVPPIRTTSTPPKSATPVAGNGEIYTQDGDYIKDIEVNDLRNRYTLTKGSTQKMIKEETGADVTTRGEYYPDKSMATPAAPPLFLHITSTTKEGLEKAVGKIEELMQQELPNLVDERRFRRREPEPFERDEYGRRKWPEERIPIDLEPIPGFNLRAQVVGAGGAYVKYIQGKTKCRVQIKGRGSGFTEHGTGRESDEPMYLHVAGPDPAMVQLAKDECVDLLGNVKKQYEQFKQHGSSYGRGDHHGGGGRQGPPGERHDRNGSYGGNSSYSQYSGHQSPPATAMSPAPGAQPDYSAQWAAYYAQAGAGAATGAAVGTGADPYAAYGGYESYMQMYAQYYQQQYQQAGSPVSGADVAHGAALPGAPASAPPPPPGEGAPPPPPGATAAPGGYNAVPPPPGM